MKLKIHEVANLFPPIKEADFKKLAADIRENGQREPILITPDYKIVDGVHRYKALSRMKVEPKYEVVYLSEEELLKLALSKNMFRRHLTASQRAMIAAEFAKLRKGTRTDLAPNEAKSEREAAELTGSSRTSVQRAVKVKGVQELVEAVKDGRVDVETAAEAAELDPEDQKEVVNSVNPKTEVKIRKRKKKAEAIAAATEAASKELGVKQYSIIYADPPWQFETRSEAGMDRSADNHYPTMKTEKIADLDVPGAAHKDCILLLWATVPMLLDALHVMQVWGFEYKSHTVWIKSKAGTWYWYGNQHELLLLGTRGSPPLPETASPSVFEAEAGRHSEKPATVRAWIVKTWPKMPKLELFVREPAEGWDSWGNEID